MNKKTAPFGYKKEKKSLNRAKKLFPLEMDKKSDFLGTCNFV
jgi:hypothetical protein